MSSISNKSGMVGTTRSRKKVKSKFNYCIFAIVFLFIILFVFYIVNANQYKKVFFPNTRLNGIDVSKKNILQVEELINEANNKYILHLKTRSGEILINSDLVGLRIDANEEINKLLDNQKIYTWIKYIFVKQEFNIDTLAKLDEDKFEKNISSLDIFDKEKFIKPISARIEYNKQEKKYDIIPETKGTELDIEKTKEGIKKAILQFLYEYDLDKSDVYKKADVESKSEKILKAIEIANTYIKSTISYEKVPVLDSDTISDWIVIDNDFNVSLNEEKLANYVNTIANSYNTIDKIRDFKTSYNNAIVKVPAGNYGFKVDKAKEASEIKEIIKSGSNVMREPAFSKKAAKNEKNDYGNSYVEVNLTAQHLFLYKDGKKLFESDFVSGNISKNYTTPSGIYALSYKQRDAILKGENYRTPVNYWMPFNNNIGFHDAKWRSNFGGDIYKTNGSHGCINMPPENAKILFENIKAGFPIICYKLAGTERKSKEVKAPQKVEITTVETTITDSKEHIQSSEIIKEKETTKGPDNPTPDTKGPGLGLEVETGPIVDGPGRIK